jgi:hypothetical protein
VQCLIQQDEDGGYLTEAFDFLKDIHFLAARNEIPNFPHERTYEALYKAIKATRIYKRSTLMREIKSKFKESVDKEKEVFEGTSSESDTDESDGDDLDSNDHDGMRDSGNTAQYPAV